MTRQVRQMEEKMGKDITKILVECMLDKILQDSRSSPRRLARNLVDISLNFAKGRFQKRFLSDAQEMLKNPESAYYELVSDQIANVDRKHMVTFGMNLGYNGCTVGAKRIREIEAEQNLNIPWSLSLLLDRERLLINPDSYCRIIEQGRKIGIYVYLFFLHDENADLCLPLIENYPNCAFGIFLQNCTFSDAYLEKLQKCGNAMTVIYADEAAPESCQRLREKRLLYGIHYSYDETDLEKILSESWLTAQEPLRPCFAFLHARDSCSLQTQNEIYQHVLAVRSEQKHPILYMELRQDIYQIDEIISDDACLVGFREDGSVHMRQQTQNRTDVNIFSTNLLDLLKTVALKQANAPSAEY